MNLTEELRELAKRWMDYPLELYGHGRESAMLAKQECVEELRELIEIYEDETTQPPPANPSQSKDAEDARRWQFVRSDQLTRSQLAEVLDILSNYEAEDIDKRIDQMIDQDGGLP